MAVFSKKNETSGGGDDTVDYLCIPSGTRFSTSPEGKIVLHFAGDMFFGESLPDIGELQCGRNLSIDSGVTLRADVIKVKALLDIGSGAKLLARRVEAETLHAEKARIEVREIHTTTAEFRDSDVTADTINAKNSVTAERGELEIGTIKARSLNIAKGTRANIQVTHAAKLEGQVSQGGYASYDDLLAKIFIYHPEILTDETRAKAQRMVENSTGRLKTVRDLVQQGNTPAPAPAAAEGMLQEIPADVTKAADAATPSTSSLGDQAAKLASYYTGRESPKEIKELLGYLDGGKMDDLRRRLNPIYQRLAAQGRIPDPVMEAFLELQRLLKEGARGRKEASSAA